MPTTSAQASTLAARRRLPLLLLVALIFSCLSSADPRGSFREIAPGLDFAEFDSPVPAAAGASKVIVVRADPARLNLTLLMSSRGRGRPATVKEWADRNGLLAAINASMYQADFKTSTGLMRHLGHVNNPAVNKRFGAFLLWNPANPKLPPFHMVDRDVEDVKPLLKKYRSVIQNYRMIDSNRKNTWSAGGAATPIACVSVDGKGRALFIFTAALFTVRDFGEAILALPIDVRTTMYVEGGPPAGLYVSAGKVKQQWSGSFDLYPLPNVLGIIKKRTETKAGA